MFFTNDACVPVTSDATHAVFSQYSRNIHDCSPHVLFETCWNWVSFLHAMHIASMILHTSRFVCIITATPVCGECPLSLFSTAEFVATGVSSIPLEFMTSIVGPGTATKLCCHTTIKIEVSKGWQWCMAECWVVVLNPAANHYVGPLPVWSVNLKHYIWHHF